MRPVTTTRWLDQTGLNIIRVIFASYFVAVSLDLVHGFDKQALFLSIFDPATADLIGSTLLFSLALLFMIGLHLRMTALTLALFVMTSSAVSAVHHFDFATLNIFWRDLAFTAAILLSYSTMSDRQLRRAVISGRRRDAMTTTVAANTHVQPRRVSRVKESGPLPLRVKKPAKPVRKLPKVSVFDPMRFEDDRDAVNIFAEA